MAGRANGYRAATGAVLVLAFAWCWVCGNRGLFPLDQSIVLDGAWRIASGQVPFVDFTTPHGLTIMGLQAAVFRLFGPGYDVYVGFAALLNVLATLLAMALVGRVLPDRPGLRLLAGLLTAIWFQPPFGTPYSEQTAFFFSLCGLVATIEGCRCAGTRRGALLFGAGACAWLAFLSKQNAGGLFLPVYAGTVLLFADATDGTDETGHAGREGRRAAVALRSLSTVAAGFLAAAALFTLWLFTASEPTRFWAAYFQIPSGQLLRRLDAVHVLVQPWLGAGRGPTKIVLMTWLIVAAVSIVSGLRRHGAARKSLVAAGLGGIVLIVYQNLFNLTTRNSGENGFAFIGVITALSLGVGLAPEPATPRGWRSLLGRAGAALLVVVLLARGVEIGWSRTMHDSMRSSSFSERLDRPRWKSLLWPMDLDLNHGVVAIGDTRRLVAWLEGDGRDFFVFPDFTWLYAALERPSPQPVLWFDRGLTYPGDYDPAFDGWIVDSLEQRRIEVLVLERQSFIGPLEQRLADFPRLAQFIESEFDEVARFGNFIVLERGGAGARAEIR